METYQLKSGNIIITSMEGVPVLEHAGIVVVELDNVYVWHITPKNGILKEKISDFLATRRIIQIRNRVMSNEQINLKIIQLRNTKYDWFDFNCFHFVNKMSVD